MLGQTPGVFHIRPATLLKFHPAKPNKPGRMNDNVDPRPPLASKTQHLQNRSGPLRSKAPQTVFDSTLTVPQHVPIRRHPPKGGTILLPRRPVAPVTKTFFILNSRLRPETSLCRIALFQTAPKLIKNKDSLRSHTAIAENTVTPSFAYFIGRSQCQFKLFPLNQAAKSEIF